MRAVGLAMLAAMGLLASTPTRAADLVPVEVGQCVLTTVSEIGSRLEGVPDSGDAVVYANDVYGVSYDKVAGLEGAKVGDEVKLCLTALPEDCPPGDDRGKFYSASDLRTGKDWELPDAEHMCGGA